MMISLDCKIINFSLGFCLFVLTGALKRKNYHLNSFLVCAKLLASGKFVSRCTLYSLMFSPLHMKNSMKCTSKINPAITENTKCLIVKAHTPTIDKKMGVLLNHTV